MLRHAPRWLLLPLLLAFGCSSEDPPPAGPDDSTGVVVDLPEPEPGPDPCIDLDECSDPFPGAAGSFVSRWGGSGNALWRPQ